MSLFPGNKIPAKHRTIGHCSLSGLLYVTRYEAVIELLQLVHIADTDKTKLSCFVLSVSAV